MRASDLIPRRVRTSDGEHIGRIFEVEAAVSAAAGAERHALQITQLFVGSRSSILRLGFHSRDMEGPIGIKFLARRLTGYKVEWAQVVEVGEEVVLGVPKAELERI
jgi:sporulation protein YlmC with PRC-barrel domain